jgi:hypothetical protein
METMTEALALTTAVVPSGSRSQPLMRSVNNDVRRVIRADAADRIPFFCECPDEGCYHPLWLTLGEYDSLAAGDAFGIAPGHDIPQAPAAFTL